MRKGKAMSPLPPGSPPKGLPRIVLSFFVLTALLLAKATSGGTVDEYQVKAAFLYNFAVFVEWSSTAFKTDKDPMQICVLGVDPFGRSLVDLLKGKTVSGRPIAVTDIADSNRASACHIVFVSSSESKRARTILKGLPATGVLTVGETDGFASEGGMVNFTREDGRLRFEINPAVAVDARLRISSRVLQLARIVKSEKE
jgi:hypothetical protein